MNATATQRRHRAHKVKKMTLRLAVRHRPILNSTMVSILVLSTWPITFFTGKVREEEHAYSLNK